MKLKRTLLAAAALGLLSLEVAPSIAAINQQAILGAFTGDMITSSGSYATQVKSFNNGTAFPTTNPIASQQSSAVAITGGNVDGTAIGNTTPSTGKFTTGTFGGALNVNGGLFQSIRLITTGATITGASTDVIVDIKKTTGSATAYNLPTGVANQCIYVKDKKGDAGTNNISVTPPSGVAIDQLATGVAYVMNTNGQGTMFCYDGTDGSWGSY